MIDFVRRWGLWRIVLITVGTALAIWWFLNIETVAERLTLVGVYLAFVFGVLAIRPPPRGDRPAIFDWIVDWIRRRSRVVQRLLGAGLVLVMLAGSGFLVYRAINGSPSELRFSPTALRVAEGKPFDLVADRAPIGQDYIDVAIHLEPIAKDGYCTTPARVEISPILDDQLRTSAVQIVRRDEVASVPISGSFDRAAIRVVVHTTAGCVVDMTVKEADYRG